MFEFHKDTPRYFKWQYLTSRDYIIPFIKDHVDLDKELNVLEIGCAEAGVLKAFTELGHNCTGIELSEHRVANARKMMAAELEEGKIRFIVRDIYDIDVEKDIGFKFDLIILKDVIEHIHKQDVFMKRVGEFLNPGGHIFFGFPPWYMPFGGHQQLAQSKFLNKLPYFHLLPMPAFRGVLKIAGEPAVKVENLSEIKETGISVERFERISKKEGFQIVRKQLFLLNPIYKFKFGLKPRKQASLVAAIPYVRDFVSTCAYYLLKKNVDSPAQSD